MTREVRTERGRDQRGGDASHWWSVAGGPRLLPMGRRSALHGRLGTIYRRWALPRRLRDPQAIAARAWRLIERKSYCLVVTAGDDGPSARVLAPLRPRPGGEIWLGTDPRSRKVEQIVRTGRCLLVYEDDRRQACVTLECDARIADPSQKARFPGFWRAFWPDGAGPEFVNIVCTPTAMEVWDGLAVIAPDPFGRRSARLERGREPGSRWRTAEAHPGPPSVSSD